MLGLGNILTKGGAVQKFPNDFSFNFDGSNDYLLLPADDNFGVNDTWSVSFWFKSDSISTTQALFSASKSPTASNRIGINLHSSVVKFSMYGTFDSTLEYRAKSSTSLSSDTWYHLVATNSNGTLGLYINNAEQTGTSSYGLSHSARRVIGAAINFNLPFDGLIDEFAIWNTVIDANTIAKLSSKPVDVTKYSASNLKLWLRAGDKAEPESNTAIARQDFYTDFDSSNTYIAIGNAIGDMSGKDVSVTVWFNSRNISDQKGIISQQDGTGTGRFLLYNESNKLKSFLGGAEHSVSTNLQANTWHHACYTMNSSTNEYKLYLDGQLGDSGTDAIESADGDFFIGTSKTLGSAVFDGAISNLALYNTALDAQTISQMAKSRFTPMRDNRFSVVDFSSSNDRIEISNNSALSFGTNVHTISAWAKLDVLANYKTIISKRQAGGTVTDYNLSVGENGVVYTYNGSAVAQTATGVISAGNWFYYALVYSGSAYQLYINGSAVAWASGDTTSGASNSHDIGIGWDRTGNYWEGSISSVSLYNVEKSAEEIYAIYQQGITYDESSLSGLVGYWKMGDDASAVYPTIADSSSNSNDGTITNGASDDIVQQMSAGYDLGSFESSSEELGASEITSESNTTFSGVTSNDWAVPSDVTKSFSNDQMIFTMDDDTPAGYVAQFQAGNFSGGSGIPLKFLKVTLDVDSTTTGSYRINNAGGSCSANVFAKNPLTTGVNTIYGLCDGANSYFRIFEVDVSTGDKLVINSFDVKEVLQSEVSDTHPAIIDVNEPVLGVDLFTDSTFDLSGTQSASTTGTHWTTGNSWTIANGEAIYDGINNESPLSLPSSTFQSAGIYKFSFTVSDASSHARIKIKADANDIIASANYSNGDHTIYYSQANAYGSAKTLKIEGRNDASGSSFKLQNASWKPVQGNVGTMTNQDSADLVYSSVLPDQSFLTGVNSAYNFIDLDGTNQYIEGSDTFPVFGTNPFSVSVWVNPTSTAQDGLFANSNGASGDYFFLSISATNFVGTGTSSVFKHKFTSSDTQLNTWQLLTYVREGTGTNQSKWYINGELKDTATDTTNWLTGTGWHIGSYNDGNGHFPGGIGQLAIWNDALTASEVSAIYTLGRHGNLLDSYSDNLLGYWAMGALDGKTGLSDVGDDTIYDRSGSSFHGIATNTEASDLKSSPNAEPNGYAKGDTNRSTTTP